MLLCQGVKHLAIHASLPDVFRGFSWNFAREPPKVSSSLMGLLAKGICGKFVEILRKIRRNLKNTYFWIASRKGVEIQWKICGNLQKYLFYFASGKSAETLRKFAEHFLQWPLTERPHKWIAEKGLGDSHSVLKELQNLILQWFRTQWCSAAVPAAGALARRMLCARHPGQPKSWGGGVS